MKRKMGRPLSTGDIIFNVINYTIMILLAFVCVYPFYYTFVASVSEPMQLAANNRFLLLPLGFTWRGYQLTFNNPNILLGYRNTILYMVTGTIINLVMTSIGAFVLSRRNVRYTKYLMRIIVVTMYFSGGLIPSYILIHNLNMYGTIWALILPGAISTWNLIVMRTAFLEVPPSLEESAKIDGAGVITILLQITLPVTKATIAVMTLFYAVAHWNSWFNAMIYLDDRKMFPLALILREILIENDTSSMVKYGADISAVYSAEYKRLVQYCVVIIATVPITLIYPFLQKYFIKGVMIGSIKE